MRTTLAASNSSGSSPRTLPADHGFPELSDLRAVPDKQNLSGARDRSRMQEIGILTKNIEKSLFLVIRKPDMPCRVRSERIVTKREVRTLAAAQAR